MAIILLGLGAAAAAAAGSLQARLVNKQPAGEPGPVSFYLGQVEVTRPDGTSKLLPYWSYLEPQVAGERVVFLPTRGLKLTRIFFYHPQSDKITSYRLPLDLDPFFGCPSFSPDGKKIAYYLVKERKVIVRSWPALKLLKESPPYPLRPTDVPPMPPVWTSPTRVEFDPLFFLPEQQITFELEN
ncbi:MAG: PD40 domain-containing protein [Deltaproteobacteria bacterium]|nr:PD40 domain-containing protein [Deltaproteobacteria bacterium]